MTEKNGEDKVAKVLAGQLAQLRERLAADKEDARPCWDEAIEILYGTIVREIGVTCEDRLDPAHDENCLRCQIWDAFNSLDIDLPPEVRQVTYTKPNEAQLMLNDTENQIKSLEMELVRLRRLASVLAVTANGVE